MRPAGTYIEKKAAEVFLKLTGDPVRDVAMLKAELADVAMASLFDFSIQAEADAICSVEGETEARTRGVL